MPSPTFDPIIQVIRKANPRTQILTYDLYGRGYSGRPEFVDNGNEQPKPEAEVPEAPANDESQPTT